AERKQKSCEHAALLAIPQRDHLGVVGLAFDAAIPAVVFRDAVPIAFAVRLVVLFVVADEILKREPVMRRDEIDAGPGPPSAAVEQIGRAGDTLCDLADQPAVTAPEAPDRVAVLVVPFRPAGREVAELIAAEPHVPGFRNQLDL